MSWRRPRWSHLALLSFVVFLAGGLAYLGTWPPYVQVLSDSMEPEIEVGDIVLLKGLDRPPEVGDIVVIRVPEVFQERLPPVVIHRIIAIHDGEAQTKGDNIDTPDPFVVPVDGLDTRVLTVLPGAAEVLAFLRSPFGLIWAVAGVFLLVILPVIDAQKQRVALAASSLQSTDQLGAELRKLREDTETILGIHRQDDDGEPPLPIPMSADGGEPRSSDRRFRPPRRDRPLGAVTIDVPGHPSPPQVHPDEPTLAMIAEVQDHLARAAEEDAEVKDTIGELVGAVGEYGGHLRSHTAILQSMSAASADLAEVVAALKGTLEAPRSAPPETDPTASAEAPASDLDHLEELVETSELLEEVTRPADLSFLDELLAVTPDQPASTEASTDQNYLDQLLEAFRSSPSRDTAPPLAHEPHFLDALVGASPAEDQAPAEPPPTAPEPTVDHVTNDAPQAPTSRPDPDPEDPAPWLDIVLELFPTPEIATNPVLLADRVRRAVEGRAPAGWALVRVGELASELRTDTVAARAALALLAQRGVMDVVEIALDDLYLCDLH